MFDWYARFTRSPSSPPGLERKVLEQLPRTFGFGCVAIALPSLLLRLARLAWPQVDTNHLVQTTDFLAIGVFMVHLTAVVTVAIGAFMVVVMKGPVQTADSYPLSDAERPARIGDDRNGGEFAAQRRADDDGPGGPAETSGR
jgi:hypothetical protein